MHELGIRLATPPSIRWVSLLRPARQGGRREWQRQDRAGFCGVVHRAMDLRVAAGGVMANEDGVDEVHLAYV